MDTASIVQSNGSFVLPNFSNLPMIQSDAMLKLAQLKRNEEEKQKLLDLEQKKYEDSKKFIDSKIQNSYKALADDRALSYGQAAEGLATLKEPDAASQQALVDAYNSDDLVKGGFAPPMSSFQQLREFAKAKKDPIAKERMIAELETKIGDADAGLPVYTGKGNRPVVDAAGNTVEMNSEREYDKSLLAALKQSVEKKAPTSTTTIQNITPKGYKEEQDEAAKLGAAISEEKLLQQTIKDFGKGAGTFAELKITLGNAMESVGAFEDSKLVRESTDLKALETAQKAFTLKNLKNLVGSSQISNIDLKTVKELYGTVGSSYEKLLLDSRTRLTGYHSLQLMKELTQDEYAKSPEGVNPYTVNRKVNQKMDFNKIAKSKDGRRYTTFYEFANHKENRGLEFDDLKAKWLTEFFPNE